MIKQRERASEEDQQASSERPDKDAWAEHKHNSRSGSGSSSSKSNEADDESLTWVVPKKAAKEKVVKPLHPPPAAIVEKNAHSEAASSRHSQKPVPVAHHKKDAQAHAGKQVGHVAAIAQSKEREKGDE